MTDIPRIRGRAGQAEPGQGYDDKWFYEISFWDFTGETRIGEPFVLRPFDTKADCVEVGRKAVRKASEAIAYEMTGQEPTGKYFDLKNGGILRPWDEQ